MEVESYNNYAQQAARKKLFEETESGKERSNNGDGCKYFESFNNTCINSILLVFPGIF